MNKLTLGIIIVIGLVLSILQGYNQYLDIEAKWRVMPEQQYEVIRKTVVDTVRIEYTTREHLSVECGDGNKNENGYVILLIWSLFTTVCLCIRMFIWAEYGINSGWGKDDSLFYWMIGAIGFVITLIMNGILFITLIT